LLYYRNVETDDGIIKSVTCNSTKAEVESKKPARPTAGRPTPESVVQVMAKFEAPTRKIKYHGPWHRSRGWRSLLEEVRPNFFMVGNSKSGTSALYFALRQHPDIFMCTPKEPNFFARDLCAGVTDGTFIQMPESDYLELFRDVDGSAVIGDASACYLYSSDAARLIHTFNPEAKILIILREPVAFLYSYYTQLLKNPGSENEIAGSFEEALELEPQRREGQALPPGCQVPALLLYMDRVRYADQVQRYLDLFPPEQIKILLYDDLVDSNVTFFDEVTDFLGVARYPAVNFEIRNPSALVRSKTARQALYDLSTGAGRLAGIQKLIKRVTPDKSRRAFLQWVYARFIFKPAPRLSAETRDRLKRTIAPEVAKLQQQLGIDLSHRWGYTLDVAGGRH